MICALSGRPDTEGNHIVRSHVMICELVHKPLRTYTCVKRLKMAYITPCIKDRSFLDQYKSPEHIIEHAFNALIYNSRFSE